MNVYSDLIAFTVALFASLSLTVPVRHLALRYGMVDQPGPRKVHLKPIPLLGGIAIYLGFVLAILLTLHGAPQQQIARHSRRRHAARHRRLPRRRRPAASSSQTVCRHAGRRAVLACIRHSRPVLLGVRSRPGRRGSRRLLHDPVGRRHHRFLQHPRSHGRPLRGNRRRRSGLLHPVRQPQRPDCWSARWAPPRWAPRSASCAGISIPPRFSWAMAARCFSDS